MHLSKEGKVIIGLISLIIFTYLSVIFIQSTQAYSRADEVKFKIFQLLNLELLEQKPTPTLPPGAPTPTPIFQQEIITKIYHSEGGQKKEIGTGKFSLSERYTLNASFDVGRSNASDKKYVVWLNHDASYIQIGEFVSQNITITNYKNDEDLTEYSDLIVTEETTDFNDPIPTNPDSSVYTGKQEDVTPTSAPPPPTQRQNPTSSQPTTPQGSTPGPTSPPTGDLDTTIRSVIDAVSQSNIQKHLEELSGNGTKTRFSGTQGNQTGAQYIKQQLESYGLEVEYDTQEFSYSYDSKPITTKNIVGRLYGKDRNTFYLVTAHMDSTAERENGTTDPAPGANDNGSGTSSVLEIARAIKALNIEPERSIEFILFSGEEQGLRGSYEYVGKLAQGKRIAAVVNLDMVGNDGPRTDCVNFNFKPGSGGNIITDTLVDVNSKFKVGLNTVSRADSNGSSDHAPFWLDGITTAIFGFECNMGRKDKDGKDVYHTTNDIMSHMSLSQVTKTAKVTAGGLVKLVQSGIGENINSLVQKNTAVKGTSSDARIFALIYYTDLPDLDFLFDNTTTSIDYLQGDDIDRPFFLGLFTEGQIASVKNKGYGVRIIDENVDINRYAFVFHPDKNQGAKLQPYGEVFEASPQHFLIKMKPGEEFTHNGVLGEFFDLPLPQGISKPPFRTVTITIAPEPSAEPPAPSVQPKVQKAQNNLVLIILTVVFISIILGAVVFIIRAKRAQNEIV